MSLFRSLFGKSKSKPNLNELRSKGCPVVDVRSAGEFRSGHLEGSVNIPLNEVGSRINEFEKMNQPIILCCASGMRSGKATQMLTSKGIEAVNGGGWTKVKSQLNAST